MHAAPRLERLPNQAVLGSTVWFFFYWYSLK